MTRSELWPSPMLYYEIGIGSELKAMKFTRNLHRGRRPCRCPEVRTLLISPATDRFFLSCPELAPLLFRQTAPKPATGV